MPDWSAFDAAELGATDDAWRERFRARAVPAPAALALDAQAALSDDARFDVPATMICTDFTSDDVRQWLDDELPPARDLARVRDLSLVDLPGGHWPQLTAPGRLAMCLLGSIGSPIVDDQGRIEPPVEADETETLLGFLDFHRATLAWKCADVDDSALRATVGRSSMTLGGLLKHLALVEDDWFQGWLLGRPDPAPWDAVDWAADRDWEWHSALEETGDYLRGLWADAVGRSRAALAEALATGGLDQPAHRRWLNGRPVSLRWILTHLIEEYARHNGHADLLREAVDGRTGE